MGSPAVAVRERFAALQTAEYPLRVHLAPVFQVQMRGIVELDVTRHGHICLHKEAGMPPLLRQHGEWSSRLSACFEDPRRPSASDRGEVACPEHPNSVAQGFAVGDRENQLVRRIAVVPHTNAIAPDDQPAGLMIGVQ